MHKQCRLGFKSLTPWFRDLFHTKYILLPFGTEQSAVSLNPLIFSILPFIEPIHTDMFVFRRSQTVAGPATHQEQRMHDCLTRTRVIRNKTQPYSTH